jgi:hypothetical protein
MNPDTQGYSLELFNEESHIPKVRYFTPDINATFFSLRDLKDNVQSTLYQLIAKEVSKSLQYQKDYMFYCYYSSY